MMQFGITSACRILVWFIALILIGFCFEFFFDLILGRYSRFSQFLNVIMVSGLLVAFLVLVLINRKVGRLQHCVHSREKLEIQRQVDKNLLRYKNLLENAGDAIFVLEGKTGLLEEVNRRGAEMLGYSWEEMRRMAGSDIFPCQDRNPFLAMARQIKRYGAVVAVCLTFQRKDGSQFVGEVNAA